MIRWLAIEHALKESLGSQHITIYASSDMPQNLRAAVEVNGDHAYIILSLAYAKRESDVVKSVAHEGAHVKLMTYDHGPEFKAMRDQILTELERALS